MRANAVAATKKKTETTTEAESAVDQVFPPAEAVAAADPMPMTIKRVTAVVTPESNLAHLRQGILRWRMQCARRQRHWNRQLWQWMWH